MRTARAFDPDDTPATPAPGKARLEPDEVQALEDKAVRAHHEVLRRLHARLVANHWRNIEEIPAAIDLRAQSAHDRRVIFEAKTITGSNETAQSRSALAQLLEYRLEHGHADDALCLVANAPVSLRRARLLDALEVAVLVLGADGCRAGNDRGSALLAALGDAR